MGIPMVAMKEKGRGNGGEVKATRIKTSGMEVEEKGRVRKVEMEMARIFHQADR